MIIRRSVALAPELCIVLLEVLRALVDLCSTLGVTIESFSVLLEDRSLLALIILVTGGVEVGSILFEVSCSLVDWVRHSWLIGIFVELSFIFSKLRLRSNGLGEEFLLIVSELSVILKFGGHSWSLPLSFFAGLVELVNIDLRSSLVDSKESISVFGELDSIQQLMIGHVSFWCLLVWLDL